MSDRKDSDGSTWFLILLMLGLWWLSRDDDKNESNILDQDHGYKNYEGEHEDW